MRKYAYLKTPYPYDEKTRFYKVMLYEAKEGVYLFGYACPDALLSCADFCYASLPDLYEDWEEKIDENGWVEMEDPLPDCQHDAFLPLRVKGREKGTPEWGKYEILQDGTWIDYDPQGEK